MGEGWTWGTSEDSGPSGHDPPQMFRTQNWSPEDGQGWKHRFGSPSRVRRCCKPWEGMSNTG